MFVTKDFYSIESVASEWLVMSKTLVTKYFFAPILFFVLYFVVKQIFKKGKVQAIVDTSVYAVSTILFVVLGAVCLAKLSEGQAFIEEFGYTDVLLGFENILFFALLAIAGVFATVLKVINMIVALKNKEAKAVEVKTENSEADATAETTDVVPENKECACKRSKVHNIISTACLALVSIFAFASMFAFCDYDLIMHYSIEKIEFVKILTFIGGLFATAWLGVKTILGCKAKNFVPVVLDLVFSLFATLLYIVGTLGELGNIGGILILFAVAGVALLVVGLVFNIKRLNVAKKIRKEKLAEQEKAEAEKIVAENALETQNGEATSHVVDKTQKSYFDGRLIQMIGWNLLSALVTVVTLGIAYPATLCWKEKWYAKHKVYDGYRLGFNGRGIQLFGKWLLWMLLTVVTLGIYSLWILIKLEKWRVSHLYIQD